MGVSKYDNESTQRRLEALYVLTTAEGVEALLDRLEKEQASMLDRGDYGTVDLLIDFSTALTQAKLSDKQRRAVDYVLVQGYTQEEFAGIEGITQQSVNDRLKTATQKIAGVYRYWLTKGAY